MKKLILFALVLGAFMATNASAQTTCWCYGGESEETYWYLYDYDGYVLEEGDYVYMAWVGPDGEIDPPATSKGVGGTTDDDSITVEGAIHDLGGYNIPQTVFPTGTGFPEAGMVIYARIFDAPKGELTTANYYSDASNLHTLSGAPGDEYFALFPGDPGAGYTKWPLPVELMSFDAIGRDGEVLLEWKTATETNLLGFYIERDQEPVSDLIEGHGNSTVEQTYTWVDKGLTNGTTYYYNLITQDLDGVKQVANEQPVAATPTAHIPTVFALHQNYPNPFNPYTDIKYDIPKDAHVTLKVYNVLGAEVATLVDKDQKANFYTVRWDAKDLASGVYFCTITADDFKAVKKMVLLK